MKPNLLAAGLFGLALILTGCAPATNPAPGGSASLADVVPLVGFSTSSSRSAARLVTSAGTTRADAGYAILAPSLTGFAPAQGGVAAGQVFHQDLLGTQVDLTARAFHDGTNGIPSGVRFTGVLADGSGTLVLELDPRTKAFFFSQGLYVDDAAGAFNADAERPQKLYLLTEASGTLGTDRSTVATGRTAILGISVSDPVNHTEMVYAQFCSDTELYLGPWNAGGTESGAAFSYRLGAQKTGPSALGTTTLTLAAAGKDQLAEAMAWLKATRDALTASDYADHPGFFYRSSAMAHSGTNSASDLAGVVAEQNAASTVWKDHSVIFH